MPLPDLIEARDALRDRIKRAKLKANPLFIDLDDDVKAADQSADKRVEDLIKVLDQAIKGEAAKAAPPQAKAPPKPEEAKTPNFTEELALN